VKIRVIRVICVPQPLCAPCGFALCALALKIQTQRRKGFYAKDAISAIKTCHTPVTQLFSYSVIQSFPKPERENSSFTQKTPANEVMFLEILCIFGISVWNLKQKTTHDYVI